MLKDKLSKNEARQVYVVVNLIERNNIPYAIIQKFEDKFMSRQYQVPVDKLLLLPNQENIVLTNCINLKSKARYDSVSVPPTHSWDY